MMKCKSSYYLLLTQSRSAYLSLRPTHPVDLLDELVYLIFDLLLVFLLVHVEYPSIDGDDGDGIVHVLKPFLMSFMHFS